MLPGFDRIQVDRQFRGLSDANNPTCIRTVRGGGYGMAAG